jgi:CDP-diacylglycerol--glycerol-3-phosphate 3-phosphatidyltransferase
MQSFMGGGWGRLGGGAGIGEDVFGAIGGLPSAGRVFRLRGMRLTLADWLTVSRVPAMFAIVWLMNSDFEWAATIAFWLFIAAALTDWLDGMIARARGEVSPFGRFMDAVIDKVMVVGLMIALVNGHYFMGYEVAAMLLLLGILGREFAISGMRMAAATKGLVVEADMGGKVKTFVQLNAIGWLIGARMMGRDFGSLFGPDDRWIVAFIQYTGMGLYLLAAVLTITSGISYFRRHGRVVME